MSSVIIHPAVEPGVIDNNMLIKCVLEQGPKGEAGRLFAEEGVHLEEVKIIRLEFFNIIRIDHLWMLKSLTKLALNHNLIEMIENLDQLKSLIELDLSFNAISVIENLNELTNIEVLILSYNKIKKIENIDNLEKLIVIGLAGNKITDYKEAIYLRNFRELRSLSFKDNPCCTNPDTAMFLKAALPKVAYIDYILVPDEDRDESVDKFCSIINKLNEIDEAKEITRQKQELYNAKVKFYAMSFVEYLSGPELFDKMYELDADGSLLLKAGQEMILAYEEYREFYVETMQGLVDFGLSQYSVRKKEVEIFQEVMDEAREGSSERSKECVKKYTTEKEELFEMAYVIVDSVESESVTIDEVGPSLVDLIERFNSMVKDLWINLMREEMSLYEQCEETRIQFSQNVKDLANKMVEFARGAFTKWRDREGLWNMSEMEILSKIMTKGTLMFEHIPELVTVMTDKDLLMDTIAQSTDCHMRFIDDREDYVLTRVNEWQDELLHKATWEEIKRDRSRVLEINYYVDNQKDEWKQIMSRLLELEGITPEIEALILRKESETNAP